MEKTTLLAEPLNVCVCGWISGATMNHQQCDEMTFSQCVCVGGLAEQL